MNNAKILRTLEQNPTVNKIARSLMAIARLDWKACLFCLLGFLGGVSSNSIAGAYGHIIGLGLFMFSWWFILAGLIIAHRKADLPIYKIGVRNG